MGRGVWQIVIYPTDGNIRLLALSRGEIQYIWLDGVPGDSFLAEYSNMESCDWHFSSEMGRLAVEFRLAGRKDKAVDMT